MGIQPLLNISRQCGLLIRLGDAKRFIGGGDCIGRPLYFFIKHREGKIRIGHVGLELRCLLIMLDRFAQSAGCRQDRCQIQMCFCIARIKFQRLLELRDGLGNVAGFGVCNCEVVMRLGIIWREIDRFLETSDRLLRLPRRRQRNA